MQETLCFEKSGVVLQFNDPESFLNDGQRVRSKICWDKALTVSLPSHEIQLSPAIQFYPHGSKLSKPVHATVPHSALMDSGHGWSIGLKSFTLGSGSKVVWKDEIVDKIHDNEVSFYMDCLLAYVVVGTPVYKCSKATKKRFQSAVFGGEGKVGQDYTVYLYLFDDCEASLEVLPQHVVLIFIILEYVNIATILVLYHYTAAEVVIESSIIFLSSVRGLHMPVHQFLL